MVDAERGVPRRTGTCPICKSATVERYRPFCSKRCADIDLGRWIAGSYTIAGNSDDDDEDGGAAAENPAGTGIES